MATAMEEIKFLGEEGFVSAWCRSKEQPLGHESCPYTGAKCACECHKEEA